MPPGTDTQGDKILVARDGSAKATRAVHDALPFLKAAGQVEIVSISGEKDLSTSLPGRPRASFDQTRRQLHGEGTARAGRRCRWNASLPDRPIQSRHARHGRLRPFTVAATRARWRHPDHAEELSGSPAPLLLNEERREAAGHGGQRR